MESDSSQPQNEMRQVQAIVNISIYREFAPDTQDKMRQVQIMVNTNILRIE